MKKTAIFIFTSLSILLLASCEQEEPIKENLDGVVNKGQGDIDLARSIDEAVVAVPVFFISPTETVTPAKGNLQYRASTGEYRFAENQYDVVGELNEYISDTYDGWIDLFAKGTGDNPTNISANNEDYLIFSDWGNYMEGDWRTLSFVEWNYMLRHHAKGSATVCGVHGIVLLPSGWVLPHGCTFNSGVDGWNMNSYDAAQWEKMEQAGALFLPAAGYREGTTVHYVGDDGYYWSSSLYYDDFAYYVYFYSSDANMGYGDEFGNGCSVRLFQNL